MKAHNRQSVLFFLRRLRGILASTERQAKLTTAVGQTTEPLALAYLAVPVKALFSL